MVLMLRHPLADSFETSLYCVKLLARRFAEPATRSPAIRDARAALLKILRGDPVPGENLRAVIKEVQADLTRITKSPRCEYAATARIDRALTKALGLVGELPNSLVKLRQWPTQFRERSTDSWSWSPRALPAAKS
jgi:hypothetical protein